ncbi:MAG: tRNA (guanosine(37)-N1)-methyltransferase TrmD [Clostridia bacterium]|nr:tRNA (guanosine(37)-N1)-methyltransferase TrmD [Clostridia bacterium]
MKIDVLTIFPEMFGVFSSTSIIGRACENGILDIRAHDIREYTTNKHRKVDDYPYGGGAGMVMMAQPIYDCIEDVRPDDFTGRVILMTPRGKQLTTDMARQFASFEHLIILCGHYEGIDERVSPLIDEEISIGDYILTGGEIPAMVFMDCVSRFIPGVLGSIDSVEEESFSNNLLEYPQYTRPAEFRGMCVPEPLLNGNHKEIREWRLRMAEEKTKEMRPEMYERYSLLKQAEEELKKKSKRKRNRETDAPPEPEIPSESLLKD